MDENSIKTEELARYLSGESSESERASVKAWKNKTVGNRQKFEEFKRIWETSALHMNESGNMFDTRKDWKLLSSRIDAEEAKSASHLSDYTNGTMPGNRGWQTLIRAAAIFLIAGLIGFFAYKNWEPAEQVAKKPALREITTDIGQRVNLTLSDGTKVLLNAGSKMKLPEVFDADKREVFLVGQAYFNVTKNSEKPFVIHSGDAKTQVLGTSFSVSAYPEDEQITIAVKEGRVSFQAQNKIDPKETIVKGQEFAQFNLKTHQLKTQRMADAELYLGWVQGYLKFKEAPMTQVATELERRYGVSVTFANPQIKEQLFTAMLKSRSIKNVLDVISMSLEINYTLDGDRVTFQS